MNHNSTKQDEAKLQALDPLKMKELLCKHPHTAIHAQLSPRDYIANRMAILDASGIIPLKKFGNYSVNQALSKLCGFNATTLYSIYSPNAVRYNGKFLVPKWKHAMALHRVTHGFIHTRYVCPDLWCGMIELFRMTMND